MDLQKGKERQPPLQYMAQTFKIILLGALILSSVFIISQFKLSNYFPIKTVRIYGINRIDRQEVQTLLQPLVNQGFFTVKVDYIRDRLSQIPWVSDIFVRRNWPDQVEITIIEKKPIAEWNNQSLLSEAGEIFSPKQNTYPAELPKFIGPDGKQIMMLQYFYEINRLLKPLHAKISYLELTPYLTWKFKMNNGIMMQIGHKDILTRLNHFVKVYPKIVGDRAVDVEYIDLRYSNGVAVRWRTIVKT